MCLCLGCGLQRAARGPTAPQPLAQVLMASLQGEVWGEWGMLECELPGEPLGPRGPAGREGWLEEEVFLLGPWEKAAGRGQTAEPSPPEQAQREGAAVLSPLQRHHPCAPDSLHHPAQLDLGAFPGHPAKWTTSLPSEQARPPLLQEAMTCPGVELVLETVSARSKHRDLCLCLRFINEEAVLRLSKVPKGTGLGSDRGLTPRAQAACLPSFLPAQPSFSLASPYRRGEGESTSSPVPRIGQPQVQV